MKKKKIIVIGIDGCDFRIIEPLIEAKILPTFSEIIEKGTSGTLMSTIPPSSLPAWTSILTGLNPGKHGTFDFLIRDRDRFRLASRNKKVETIYTLLDRIGFRQIIVNDPITYPPIKLNGIMLTGLSTPPGSKNFIFPNGLRDEIDDICEGYQPDLDFDWNKDISSGKNNIYDSITEFAIKNYKAAIHLGKKYDWDLFSVTFTSTDRLQHYFYNDWQLISAHYKMLDGMLKEIISMESEANIIIISDHGFGPLNKCFYINTWFKEKNLIYENKNIIHRLLSKLGLTYNKIASILLKLKLYEYTSKMIPQSIKKEIPTSTKEIKTDHERSSAFINTINGGIYINKPDILPNIINQLKSLNINGENPIQSIHMRDEVWWGPHTVKAPELILTPKYGYEISPKHAPSILDKPSKDGDLRTGTHRPEGIFIAYGPDIKKNYKLDKLVQTWDVAPTILSMMSVPIPNYMDGIILKNMFINKH